jgi:hypothetical protein
LDLLNSPKTGKFDLVEFSGKDVDQGGVAWIFKKGVSPQTFQHTGALMYVMNRVTHSF